MGFGSRRLDVPNLARSGDFSGWFVTVCLRIAMILATILLQISSIASGEKIFAQSCSVGYCHGAAGAAARGPRLRGRTFDKNYLYSAIRDGIPKSAMPAWKDRLKDDEIRATVAYIQSLANLRSLAKISWTFEARNCTIPSWLTVRIPACVRSTLC